ncbi:MAG: hypothetical protein HY316_02340 [Acidobacteria bacterium]|nr:hypothetical protein [Acidobacteriota bacterium]
MLTKIMQWVSIAVLLPVVFWQASAGYLLALQFVVSAAAILVAWEGYRAAKQMWAIGFVAIALLFNPFQPLTFSREMFLWLDLISIATFLASLVVLKSKPSASMPSIAI